MGFFNPVYALVIPSLFFVTIPLAILASLTTTLAFSVLFLRVIVVYLDIALSVLPQSLAGRGAGSLHGRVAASAHAAPKTITAQSQSPLRSARHHRRCRSSASARSGGSTSSLSTTERGPVLIPSIGPEREFEGIGGWRRGDDNDDELWTTVNALPDLSLGRHHARASSAGATTPGEGGYLMMKGRTHSPEARKAASPNCSRARTPSGHRVGFATTTSMNQNDGGYFSLVRAKQ